MSPLRFDNALSSEANVASEGELKTGCASVSYYSPGSTEIVVLGLEAKCGLVVRSGKVYGPRILPLIIITF